MKNSFLFLLLLVALTFSCDFVDPYGGGVTINGGEGTSSLEITISPCEEGDTLDLGDLPQAILDYLDDEFPNISIDGIELFQVEDSSAFGIRLSNGAEILFDLEGLVVRFSNDEGEREINLEDLPAVIAEYIAENYPDLSIDHAEFELEFGETYIEVYLSDSTGLVFDLNGDFLCEDADGDDDGEHGGEGEHEGEHEHGGEHEHDRDSIRMVIRDFVSENYPDYEVDEIDREELCGNQKVYEVELEREDESGEPRLYFDLDGAFLFAATKISIEDLPAEVTAGLEASYPGYSIEDDRAYRHDYADGSVQYVLKIEDADDDDVELTLSSEGTVICSED